MEQKLFDAPKNIPVQQYGSLALAYMGDAVFELLIRRKMIEKGNQHV